MRETKTKTKVDWATEMAALVEGRYAGAERVIGQFYPLGH